MSERTKGNLLTVLKYLAIAFAFISIVLFYYQCVRNINKFGDIDLTSYIRASKWFFSGENPYQPVVRRFIYPQFFLLVVAPFHNVLGSPLWRGLTAFIWSGGLYLSLFLTLVASYRRYYKCEGFVKCIKENLLPISMIVILSHPLMQDEFLNGQVNLFVMGSTAAFFFFLEKNKMATAALFLALAISIKIAPGFCLLYLLFTKQFKTIIYFVLFTFLFTIGIPYLINSSSLEYYRYFVTDVMPNITGSDFEGGFKSYSIISTLSYLFKIEWYPPLKILAVLILSLGLFLPVYLVGRKNFSEANFQFKFLLFGTLVSILPMTFPMSEPHHLLLQIIPFISIVYYWSEIIKKGESLFKDKLSLLFMICALGYHIGHGLKDTPIRLLTFIALYTGLILLMKKLSTSTKQPSPVVPA